MEDARIDAWDDISQLRHGFGRRGSSPPAPGRLWLLKRAQGRALVAPPWEAPPQADAAATDAPGQWLGIQTADCLPVLFVDPAHRLAAAAHAGWRGTAAGIVRVVVD